MAQVIPLRPHTFRLDNIIIDTYAAEMGAIGVAIYAVLQRYADRTTGQCWPSVATIARLLRLSKNCVKKYLHLLARCGLAVGGRVQRRPDPCGDPLGQARRDAVFAPAARGLGEVTALAGAVDHEVGRGAVALAGDLRLAIREQLHIAVEDDRYGLVDAAVALG